MRAEHREMTLYGQSLGLPRKSPVPSSNVPHSKLLDGRQKEGE